MKDIERGSIKYLILLILWTAIFGLVLFPLFDFLSDALMNKTFTYSVDTHLVLPIVFAIVYGLTYWLLDRRKKK